MSAPIVLVVEDEPLVSELMAEALNDEGVHVLCAASFSEACELLKTRGAEIRVLFTDINLGPPPDGFAVAVEARRVNPAIFVLYTSGHAEAEVGDRGVPGAMVVPKPYQVRPLASRIAALAKVAATR